MNNRQLQQQTQIISTMVSGARDDAWHWRDSDVSQFSSEKLSGILRLAESARSEEDLHALKKVREELDIRAQRLIRK
jgi:activator of HSP90 ATPase